MLASGEQGNDPDDDDESAHGVSGQQTSCRRRSGKPVDANRGRFRWHPLRTSAARQKYSRSITTSPERTSHMDAVALLKKQHREVEDLFKKVEKAKAPEMRRQLMHEISAKLEMHTKIEEEIFYPAVREIESKKAEEMINEAFEEHGVVKLVLKQLPSVDPQDERFEAKMTVLQELVEHHVEEEEKEMFKLAQKLGKAELRSLGEQMAGMMPAEAQPKARRRAA